MTGKTTRRKVIKKLSKSEEKDTLERSRKEIERAKQKAITAVEDVRLAKRDLETQIRRSLSEKIQTGFKNKC